MKGKIINGFAVVSLFIAFFIGQAKNHDTNKYKSLELAKEYNIDSIQVNGQIAKAYRNKMLIGTIARGEAQGYGGPMEVFVWSDTTAKISGIEIGENSETLAYLNKLKRKSFFSQFTGKPLNNKLLIHTDIEAVSGATISSTAIANACRDASWEMAKNTYSLDLPSIEQHWIFGLKEILALLVFVLAFLSVFLKNKILRYTSLGISLVTIGFMFNSAISVTQFGRIFLGYIPDIHQHFVWWILLVGTISLIIIYGKNIYCNAICPFHALQLLLSKLSGENLKMPQQLNKHLLSTPKYLLWFCLVLILISKNPTIASYEPFAMVFSLEGAGIQWYILPAALFGSLISSNFFCRYFCPVGAGFNLLVKYRNKSVKSLTNQNQK